MAQYYFLYFLGWIFKIINYINFIWVLNAGQCIDTLSWVMALNISSQTGNIIYPRTWSKWNCPCVECSDFEKTGLKNFLKNNRLKCCWNDLTSCSCQSKVLLNQPTLPPQLPQWEMFHLQHEKGPQTLDQDKCKPIRLKVKVKMMLNTTLLFLIG